MFEHTIKKCDICGAFYDSDEYIRDQKINHIKTSFNFSSVGSSNTDYFNICYECSKSFEAWLNTRKKEKKIMADVKRCDLCGAHYAPYAQGTKRESNTICLEQLYKNGTMNIVNGFDACRDCLSSFNNWTASRYELKEKNYEKNN